MRDLLTVFLCCPTPITMAKRGKTERALRACDVTCLRVRERKGRRLCQCVCETIDSIHRLAPNNAEQGLGRLRLDMDQTNSKRSRENTRENNIFD